MKLTGITGKILGVSGLLVALGCASESLPSHRSWERVYESNLPDMEIAITSLGAPACEIMVYNMVPIYAEIEGKQQILDVGLGKNGEVVWVDLDPSTLDVFSDGLFKCKDGRIIIKDGRGVTYMQLEGNALTSSTTGGN